MAFDGVSYASARPIPAALYQPGSTLTGPSLADVLRGAYFLARRERRLLFQVTYPFDLRVKPLDSTPAAVVVTTWAKLADAYAYLPEGATHVVVSATVATQATEGATLRLRVTADDGTHQDVGATAEVAVTPDASFQGRIIQRAPRAAAVTEAAHFPLATPYGRAPWVSLVTAEVALSTVVPGSGLRVQVDGYCAVQPGDATAMPLYPQAFLGYYDVRG